MLIPRDSLISQRSEDSDFSEKPSTKHPISIYPLSFPLSHLQSVSVLSGINCAGNVHLSVLSASVVKNAACESTPPKAIKQINSSTIQRLNLNQTSHPNLSFILYSLSFLKQSNIRYFFPAIKILIPFPIFEYEK